MWLRRAASAHRTHELEFVTLRKHNSRFHQLIFRPNQSLTLPELATQLGLPSAEFRVDRILRGGMGECIRVVQGSASFALKTIQRGLIEDSDAWSRYLREVRVWTTLSACDGVVEALCITRIDELPVVCSRWMPGGNLAKHLKVRSPDFFFSVMARIVGTLAWAHQQHAVIHRDLKPDNILLDQDNLAFVSDWGLARPLTVATPATKADGSAPTGESVDPALTSAGQILGTVSYASPEQLGAEGNVDHRSDIYSLGCLMYEWESGSCPFTGTTAGEVCFKHLFEAPAPLGGLFKRTTFGTERLISQCLEKDPAKRPPDYASIDLALAEAARKRHVEYRKFLPTSRYAMPMVGAKTYLDVPSVVAGITNDKSTRHVVEKSDLEPFIREAEVLVATGDYTKAEPIFYSLFVPERVAAVPDYRYNQAVTIGYAICLINLDRADDAIEALASISAATQKPAEYFVNLSLALIRTSDPSGAAAAALDGLRLYPGDQDLTGNLLVAQTAMGDFDDAFETAKAVLAQKRDVHSLHEVGALYFKSAESIRETDWPLAVKRFNYAVGLLRDAKKANPRYLPARLQLAIVLEAMTAYTQCSAELVDMQDLPDHNSDRIFIAYLIARCLDGANAHDACLRFCDKWLKRFSELSDTELKERHNVVRLERVRASTIADGLCIGRMTSTGERVIVPDAMEFFARTIHDEELREPGDFCYLARFREWTEQHEEAESVLDRAEALYPRYWETPFQRASFRWRARDFGNAIGQAERAAELAPWRAQTWRLLAMVQEGLGRSDKAEATEARATEIERIRQELASSIES